MQLIGRSFDEATLLRIGAAFQRATDFHDRVPEFADRSELRQAGSLAAKPGSAQRSISAAPTICLG